MLGTAGVDRLCFLYDCFLTCCPFWAVFHTQFPIFWTIRAFILSHFYFPASEQAVGSGFQVSSLPPPRYTCTYIPSVGALRCLYSIKFLHTSCEFEIAPCKPVPLAILLRAVAGAPQRRTSPSLHYSCLGRSAIHASELLTHVCTSFER